MKVVLFCGGYGMRMRDGVSDLPKPMHHGRAAAADLARHALLRPLRAHRLRAVPGLRRAPHQGLLPQLRRDGVSNDFVLRGGDVELLGSDIQDWTITFVHTGLDSPIGERLRRVRQHVEGEEMFLANYADVLTDAPLDAMIERFRASDAVGGAAGGAAAVGVPLREPGRGRRDRVDHARCRRCRCGRTAATSCSARRSSTTSTEDCDLIGDVCAPLAKEGRMMAYRHRGFWQPADTVKERTALEAAYQSGTRPWMLWDDPGPGPAAGRHRGAAGPARESRAETAW